MNQFISPRRIITTLLILQSIGALIAGAGTLSNDVAMGGVGIAISLSFMLLTILYWRGWDFARHISILLLSISVGIALPEPFVTEHMPATIMLPAIVALVVDGWHWVLGSTVVTLGLLMIRAGGEGVYTNPVTLTLIIMMVGGLVLTRLLTDWALQSSRDRARELEAALTQADAQSRELARQRDELRFQADLLAAVEQGIIALDYTGIIRYWNRGAERIFGRPAQEALGRRLCELDLAAVEKEQTPDAGYPSIERLQSGELISGEVTLKYRDGSPMPLLLAEAALCDAQGAVNGWVSVFTDISERKLLEQQLSQARRLEGLGRLAGGVAHDFNNMLTAISGYASLAYDGLGHDHPARADLYEILASANRAAGLTRQLLAFGRRQVLTPQVVNLNALVDGIMPLLHRLNGEDVEMTYHLAADLKPVRIDPGQIEQVIMNLCINSRDAMPEGGRITIETANITLDELYIRTHPETEMGTYVLLAISDTGVGMTSDIQQRAFEPFFTTKAEGVGSGLGLAICYGIVRQHNGHIWLYSEPNRGTTLKIYLPTADVQHVPVLPFEQQNGDVSGVETVLLVEDDPAVRELAVRVLRTHGYTVLEAEHGEAALAMLDRYTHEMIDLLLTDVVMPRISGEALANRARAIYPSLKVLYMSGYTASALLQRGGRLAADIHLIQKPFTPSALVRKVREVLDKQL